jgi:uncharacterized membrane protein
VPFPGGSSTEANGINGAGQIVGALNDSAEAFHGFLDDGSAFTPFDVPFPGASNTIAVGINGAGQIAGVFEDSAGDAHGFLATPVPEPGSLALFGVGFFALGIPGVRAGQAADMNEIAALT